MSADQGALVDVWPLVGTAPKEPSGLSDLKGGAASGSKDGGGFIYEHLCVWITMDENDEDDSDAIGEGSAVEPCLAFGNKDKKHKKEKKEKKHKKDLGGKKEKAEHEEEEHDDVGGFFGWGWGKMKKKQGQPLGSFTIAGVYSKK